jgi:hypothetical protein
VYPRDDAGVNELTPIASTIRPRIVLREITKTKRHPIAPDASGLLKSFSFIQVPVDSIVVSARYKRGAAHGSGYPTASRQHPVGFEKANIPAASSSLRMHSGRKSRHAV